MSRCIAYLLEPDTAGWGKSFRYDLDGTHEVGLPGIKCPRCTAWSTVGLEYPALGAKDVPLVLRRAAKSDAPVPVQTWEALMSGAADRLPHDVLLEPGVEFGPLVGKISGRLADIMWRGSWTVVMRTQAYEVLRGEAFELTGSSPRLKWLGGIAEKLTELDIRPRVRLHDADRLYPRCEVCGRRDIDAPDSIVLDRATYDPEIPLQRIRELPTYIVISTALKKSIERHGFTGCAFPRAAVRSTDP